MPHCINSDSRNPNILTEEFYWRQFLQHVRKQMCFFRKALKSLEAIEPHVKSTTEQKHIDYHFRTNWIMKTLHLRKSCCTFLQDLGMRLKVNPGYEEACFNQIQARSYEG
ncbi:hypothetical protein L6452_16394 [Arctium lappa]|uniref:Uncharacterized protein n=1 Tax=Arctium lappa TaxID=4217 RepID=A0ACB9C0E0_ARCLA|nr:hypothetical protein L6452_16394 [Arctium lappa]